MSKSLSQTSACALALLLGNFGGAQALPWVVYPGQAGPGQGKHIVLIAGDEEYRSEEALPMLAKILAVRHGFKCTVLFSQDSASGYINPDNQTYTPGLSLLATADLLILDIRFREWPDKDMKHFADFTHSGKPMIGIRTSTHAFSYTRNPSSPYAKYHFQSSAWKGGWGRQVLGETWIDHWGGHGSQSTRGVVRADRKSHPIVKGVADIWGPTDVYQTTTLLGDADVLVDGQVLSGMKPTDQPVAGKATMPIAWIKSFTGDNQKTARTFTTTIGASQDFQSEGLRRMVINACYWGLGMEASIPEKSNVDYVGTYSPLAFSGGGYRKNVKPDDLAPLPTGLMPSRNRAHARVGGGAWVWGRLLREFNLNGQWVASRE
jgi:hypothetical protein